MPNIFPKFYRLLSQYGHWLLTVDIKELRDFVTFTFRCQQPET